MKSLGLLWNFYYPVILDNVFYGCKEQLKFKIKGH